MPLDELKAYPAGTPVTLLCQTTDRDIYYKGPPDRDRKPFTSSVPWAQLAVIPYLISGEVVGVEEQFETPTYLVLLTKGECAIIGIKHSAIKVIGYEVRQKMVHVPISAIQKRIY